MVIELGGNDALRGLPLTMTQDNLLGDGRAPRKAAGAQVLIARHAGAAELRRRRTREDFAALFAGVAKAEGAALVPFLLAGVADAPNAAGCSRPTASTRPRRRSRGSSTTSGRCCASCVSAAIRYRIWARLG